MSHHYATTSNTYALKQSFALKQSDRSRMITRLPLIFSTASTVVLAVLFLQIVSAFLSLDGMFANVLSTLSAPLAAPFKGIFPDLNQFVPIAAMIAYCVYFALYWTITLTVRSLATPYNEAT